MFQGHPFSLAHLRQERSPPLAAAAQVIPCQGHPFSLAHLRQERWPPSAAAWQVSQFQGHSFSLNHCKAWSCPYFAALQEHFSPILEYCTSVLWSFHTLAYPCCNAQSMTSIWPYLTVLPQKNSSSLESVPSSSKYFWAQEMEEVTAYPAVTFLLL